MLFKLINRLATWQKFINNLLRKYLNDFYTIYLNNIIIYFEKKENHKKYVQKIIYKLSEINLTINIKKCKFQIFKIKFLNYYIFTNKIKINSKKIAIIIK